METNNKIELYVNESQKEGLMRFPWLDSYVNDEGDYHRTTKIFKENYKAGEVLLNFIQGDLKEYSRMIFRFYGFQTLLTQEEREELLELDLNEFDEFDKIMDELYSKYKEEFEEYKRQIIDIIEYCIFDEKEELKDLKPLERLYVFTNLNSIEEYCILKHNTFSKKIKLYKEYFKLSEKKLIDNLEKLDEDRYAIQEVYEIDNFYSLLFLELYFILQEKTFLKKCKNCGKYLITTNSAVIYCDNNFENDKTCREIGASKVFIKNLEKDEAYNLYRKVYKKKQALAKSKGGKYEVDYEMFKYKGKDKKNAYKLEEITKEEFIEWLNKENE